MSADIINLRQARKQKARLEAEQTAASNRVSFWLSKTQRQASKLIKDSGVRHLDGHKLTLPKPDDG